MNYHALVFSHTITPRLEYVVDFLSEYFELSFGIISDEEKYTTTDAGCKINYSFHRLAENEIFIHSHVLLFESNIRQVKTECFEIQNEVTGKSFKAFFKTEGESGFDLFAASFYLLSRYEEYLPHQKDAYGRYAHKNSLAYTEGFLELPLVNIWLEHFRLLLANKNPLFSKSKRKFDFLPTYDIDMAWSFRNKGFKKNLAGILFLMARLKFRQASDRLTVIKGKTQDPFDSYEWMDVLHEKFNLQPVYFFLLAKQNGRYDKNINPGNIEFVQLIKKIASKYKVGIHPSWASSNYDGLLKSEKQLLQMIIENNVDSSRQHYIRFHLPSGFQKLIDAGIKHEYSMGYGSINGFRASFAGSYYWYDLQNDAVTGLRLHPFCFMDANSYYEQGLSPEAALQEMRHYRDVIKSVNSKMIMIWHNSFLGTAKEFAGWREVYEQFVSEIQL